jgi:hypothetical protein
VGVQIIKDDSNFLRSGKLFRQSPEMQRKLFFASLVKDINNASARQWLSITVRGSRAS